jgi:glycosyltransferase involved in cell wall biosynthesis
LKISIITVVFNSEHTIEQTIQSVLSQSYKNIEYIIVDAFSTDGTIKIVEKYRDQLAQIISEPDNGFYDGLNKGIELATGEVIGILNADDRFVNNEIVHQIAEQFITNKSLDSLIGDIAFSNSENKISRYYSGAKFTLNSFKWGFMPPHPSFYCKRELFNKLGLYNPKYKIAGDFELMLRFIWKHKITYKYIPLLMVYMRKGGKSTSTILTSFFVINPEVYLACKSNGLKTTYFNIYMKYFLKLGQFFTKK